MRPALSVILFTVISGAGFGLFALTVLARQAGIDIPDSAAIAALVLVALGLSASTFHLANPRNAWRAASGWRTSWLAREAVLAVLFWPLALAWLGVTWWFPEARALRFGLGAFSVLLAWATLVATGMIYACLKTLRDWHTPLTPLAFVLLAHASGAVVLLVFGVDERLRMLALLLLLLAALAKLAWYAWRTKAPARLLHWFRDAPVRLLDSGHVHDTFVSREFGFSPTIHTALTLRLLMFTLAFIAPALLLSQTSFQAQCLAAPCCLLGLLIERWLFFAEARHSVRPLFMRSV